MQRTHLILFVSWLISQPLMDCAVCYKTTQEVIEATPNPYVHCIQKPRLTRVFVSFKSDAMTQLHRFVCVHFVLHHHILLIVSLQDMSTSRTDHCRKMSYHSGAPTLLAVRTKWSTAHSEHSTLHRTMPKNIANLLHKATKCCVSFPSHHLLYETQLNGILIFRNLVIFE